MTDEAQPIPELDPAPDSYRDAVEELETILAEIESADVDVDVLAQRVARASGLVAWCRGRILGAREAVDAAAEALDD